ncbi:DUF2889 domain-containing protein [Curvivirga sp.]|uniref:DUF2889 domain-containing protein n=1 Tax=Curvivirga sp. TaxID=2856848 RepID=UPI003B5C3399
MPLPEPKVKRHHIHTRKVTVNAYIREDGLWDIEGHMSDEKSYDFSTMHRGEIKTGEHLHGMYLRLTVDDKLNIHDAEAKTDFGPYNICAANNDAYKKLIGEQIKPGFTGITRQLFKGIKGCTHMTELLGPIATTAFQSVFASSRKAKEIIGQPLPEIDPDAPMKRPPHLNTCHALDIKGPVVEELYTPFYKPEGEEDDNPGIKL